MDLKNIHTDLTFNGHQEELGGPGFLIFTDRKTGSTFAIPASTPQEELPERIASRLRAVRESFRMERFKFGLLVMEANGSAAAGDLLDAIENAERHL